VLNLSHIKTLIAVMDTGSFGSAAAKLGITQPTVSQHIRRLETLIGATLFVRGTTRTRPTESAISMMPHARAMLSINERLFNAAHDHSLVIGASSNIGTYLIQPVIREWLQSGRRCDMIIRSNPDIAALLEAGQIDIGLMEWWDNRDGFNWTCWSEEELVVVIPPSHPWAELAEIDPHQLCHEPLLGGESGTGTGRLLTAYLGRNGLSPNIGMTFSNTEAVKRAIMHGMGISLLLRRTVAEEVSAGRLQAVPLPDGGLHKTLYAIWQQHSHDESQGVHLFRDLLQDDLGISRMPVG